MASQGGASVTPPQLELVRRFVNTVDFEGRRDDLDSPSGLREWLAVNALIDRPIRLGDRDLRRARDLREAVRLLLRANNGEPVDRGEASRVLDETARWSRVVLRFDESGSRLEPAASSARAPLGRIVSAVAIAMSDGTWSRLKACRAETCRWAFYDQARNRSRNWCSMAVCGNRTKARRYRQRHGQ